MEQKRKAKEQRQAKQEVDKYAGLRYDYLTIDEVDREAVKEAAIAIKMHQRRAAENLIAIGQHLNDVKGMLPHGKFEDWVEGEFGYGLRLAQEWMAVARRFDPSAAKNEDLAVRVLAILQDKSAQNALLTPSVIRMLAAKSVPDSAIEEVLAIAETQDEPVSVEQTRAVISEHKALLPTKPPRPPKPKQLPGPVEPDAIEAEYTIIPKHEFIFPDKPKRGDQIQPIFSRALGHKLQDAVLHRILLTLLTPDEQDELLVALTRALEE
jgi:hypothetical protein